MKYSSSKSKLPDIKREIFMSLLDRDDDKVMRLLAYYEQVWHDENPEVRELKRDGSDELTSELREADRRREDGIKQKVNDHIHNQEYDRARILATTLASRISNGSRN